MKSWDNACINVGLSNGAEVDLKIEEDFKEEDLVAFLKRYAEGKEIGGNVLTSKFIRVDWSDNVRYFDRKQSLLQTMLNKINYAWEILERDTRMMMMIAWFICLRF